MAALGRVVVPCRRVAGRAGRRGAHAARCGAAAPGKEHNILKHAADVVQRGGTLRSQDDDGFSRFASMDVRVTDKSLVKAATKAMKNHEYESVLAELQVELVLLQEHIKATGQKVVVIFEGRDAAGKGGAISRITSAMSPRICKTVALAAPSEKEKTQWYFQRYVQHLPSAGEMVLFDRSWYNRAGVERVMGFASDQEYDEFMRSVPLFEEMLVNSGIKLIKLWFDVSNEEQEARFEARLGRSWKRWKLSPMDLYARSKWFDYGRARDEMFERTGGVVPWDIIPSDDKKVARLNAISHLLASIDYEEIEAEPVTLPQPEPDAKYREPKHDPKKARVVPQVYSSTSLTTDNDGSKWTDVAKQLLVDKKAKKKASKKDKRAKA